MRRARSSRQTPPTTLRSRAGANLAELTLTPALDATARFAVVTLAGRGEAPALPIVRRLVQELLRDA